jgi:hypothetical protein
MRRESFNYLRTMRQIKTGLDLARGPKRIQTTGARYRASFEKELEPHINERAIAVEIENEQRKFVRQNQALARSRQKLIATRGRLFATKAKNERLMVLRHALQKQRWLDTEGVPTSSAPQSGGTGEPSKNRPRKYRAVKVRRA